MECETRTDLMHRDVKQYPPMDIRYDFLFRYSNLSPFCFPKVGHPDSGNDQDPDEPNDWNKDSRLSIASFAGAVTGVALRESYHGPSVLLEAADRLRNSTLLKQAAVLAAALGRRRASAFLGGVQLTEQEEAILSVASQEGASLRFSDRLRMRQDLIRRSLASTSTVRGGKARFGFSDVSAKADPREGSIELALVEASSLKSKFTSVWRRFMMRKMLSILGALRSGHTDLSAFWTERHSSMEGETWFISECSLLRLHADSVLAHFLKDDNPVAFTSLTLGTCRSQYRELVATSLFAAAVSSLALRQLHVGVHGSDEEKKQAAARFLNSQTSDVVNHLMQQPSSRTEESPGRMMTALLRGTLHVEDNFTVNKVSFAQRVLAALVRLTNLKHAHALLGMELPFQALDFTLDVGSILQPVMLGCAYAILAKVGASAEEVFVLSVADMELSVARACLWLREDILSRELVLRRTRASLLQFEQPPLPPLLDEMELMEVSDMQLLQALIHMAAAEMVDDELLEGTGFTVEALTMSPLAAHPGMARQVRGIEEVDSDLFQEVVAMAQGMVRLEAQIEDEDDVDEEGQSLSSAVSDDIGFFDV